MKILVISGHPYAKSFNAAIFKDFVKNLDTKKHEVETLELGKMKFDPVLRFGYSEFMQPDAEIEKSQELVKWADKIVFIYPIWWSDMPSLLKGWFDRVMTPGFAYNVKKQGNFVWNFLTGRIFVAHLTGKTATIIATSQGPGFFYKWNLPTSHAIGLMKSRLIHTGIKTKKVFVKGDMTRDTDTLEKRQKFLTQISDYARNL